MRASFTAVLLLLTPFAPAWAAEDGASRSALTPYPASFAKSLGKPGEVPGLEPPAERAPLMHLKPGGACGASELEVCLDSTGRLTVPGARRFLPGLPGLKPERLTVKRSGVILGYSF
jgi:hypothetical protein